MSFLGLRTVIYPAPDLDAAKAAFVALLGFGPYFDEPFYVGDELGLDPNADPAGGVVVFWGVADLAVAHVAMLAAGAADVSAPNEVGEGIKVATVRTAHGELLGLIENPHFQPATRPTDATGPGR
ncbi:MAG: hypothetical protein QM733_08860 [Ilumatobacteraceae bacterium]